MGNSREALLFLSGVFLLLSLVNSSVVSRMRGSENVASAVVNEKRQSANAPGSNTLSAVKAKMTDSDWVSNNCSKVCEPGLSMKPLSCGDGRTTPEHHHICKCLVGYKCCSPTCAPIDESICIAGETMPEHEIDCCGCPMLRCIKCPKVETPKCNLKCAEIVYTTLEESKCRVPSCKIRCPEIKNKQCPKCMEATFEKNATFCGCTTKVCRKKQCDRTKAMLAPRSCSKVVHTKDECKCKVATYSSRGFCDEKNNKTQKLVCNDPTLPSHCLIKSVRKDSCGCDVGECVRKTESGGQKFPPSDVCPAGHYTQAGTTSCGSDRDICLKCPETNLEECDRTCNDVVDDGKDKNGCPVKRCVSKPCRPSSPTCSFCTVMSVTTNECRCPIIRCVRRCPSTTSMDCKGGPGYALLLMDECDCPRFTCLNKPTRILSTSINSYSATNAEYTWEEAKNHCERKGGYLALIASKAEELLIRQTTPNYKKNLTYWVGGKCSGDAGKEDCLKNHTFDIQIIVDTSDSACKNFSTIMETVSGLIEMLKIGKDKDRVGLLSYSSTKKIRTITALGEINSKEELKKVVKTTNCTRGLRSTAAAMNEAYSRFSERRRWDTAKIQMCLVFTAGDASDRNNLKAARKKWLDAEFHLFAIGLGSGVTQAGLTEITGNALRTQIVPDLNKLPALLPEILKPICRRVTALRRFVWKTWKEEFTFRRVGYPPIDISGEDNGCNGTSMGITFAPTKTGWGQLDAQKDANGVLCEF